MNLIVSGANVSDRDDQYAATPLMLVGTFNENPEGMILRLDAGSNTVLTDSNGMTKFDYIKKNKPIKQ